MRVFKHKNPVYLAFHLLEDYRNRIKTVLLASGISADQVEIILQSLEFDRGVLLSKAPTFARVETLATLTDNLHLSSQLPDCFDYLNKGLWAHQKQAIESIINDKPTVIATGTGSGKTESFLIPVVDHCLKTNHAGTPGVKAVLVYPMNALGNDQLDRIGKVLDNTGITYGHFYGNTARSGEDNYPQQMTTRQRMHKTPPDILITNPMMLDWILSDPNRRPLFTRRPGSLRYVVLDEIHTYRGNKAVHLKYLLKRLCQASKSTFLPIGASATLQSSGGYLAGEDDEIKRFVRGIFSLDGDGCITLVTPVQEKYNGKICPLPRYRNGNELGWHLVLDAERTSKLMTNLLDIKITRFEVQQVKELIDSEGYRALLQNEFVRELENKFEKEGAIAFQAVVDLFVRIFKKRYNEQPERPEEVVKGYLSILSYCMERPETVVYDLRIHIVLRDIGGSLKRCPNCDSFHSGFERNCGNCGSPLFYVDRDDINACLAKLYNTTWDKSNGIGNSAIISSELKRESDDPRLTSFIRLKANNSDINDQQLARCSISPHGERFLMTPDPEGEYYLELISDLDNSDEVMDKMIQLRDERKDYDYIFHVVRGIIDGQRVGKSTGIDRPKLLAFADSRERVSQYAHVIQELFLDQYFSEMLRRTNLESSTHLLPEVFERMNRDLHIVLQAYFATNFLNDFPLWFGRFISNRSSENANHLKLSHDSLDKVRNSLQRELVGIFLSEHAIAKDFLSLEKVEGKQLRFGRFTAKQNAGFYLNLPDREEHGRSQAQTVRSIALTEHGSATHCDFVKKHGTFAIHGALEEMADKGLIKIWFTPDKKIHYSLLAEVVELTLQNMPIDERLANLSTEQLCEQLLLLVEGHNSDLPDDRRKEIEHGFKSKSSNNISILFSTSTLEMGVDIGALKTILMVGVPPLPSNYAQRAGRAGRAESRSALIVTFCFEASEHDNWYFNYPERMINGAVSPPVADMLNPEIVARHINALIVSDQLNALNQFVRDPIPTARKWSTIIEELFAPPFDAHDHIEKRLPRLLSRNLDRQQPVNSTGLLYQLYKSPLFPDHEFRREKIDLLEEEDLDKGEKERDPLSTQTPELALIQFAPKRQIFLPGGRYEIKAPAKQQYYEKLKDSINVVRSYKFMIATEELDFGRKQRDIRKYEQSVIVEPLKDVVWFFNEGPLRIGYSSYVRIRKLNQGEKTFDAIIPFSDTEDSKFILGYEFKSDVILIQMDGNLADQPSYLVSLLSALDRSIKDMCGLDESELQIELEVNVPRKLPWSDTRSAIIYAANGNGSVPLKRIGSEIIAIAAYAKEKIESCDCESGCYVCCRSSSVRRNAQHFDREIALMQIDYISGNGNWIPELAPASLDYAPDLVFELRREGGQAKVLCQELSDIVLANNDSGNAPMFDVVTLAASEIPRPERRRLLLQVPRTKGGINWKEWIQGNKIPKKARDKCRRAQFELFKYKSFDVEEVEQ